MFRKNIILFVCLSVFINLIPFTSFAEPFSFVVFGDMNGGGCSKNDRAYRLVNMMNQTDAKFFVSTGDLIEGYGTSSCFNATHPETTCNLGSEDGNMRNKLLPLIDRVLPTGLKATFFPAIGNHDSNSDWHPDPCGTGICDLLNMNNQQIRETYLVRDDTLNVPGFYSHQLNHGDVCDKSSRNAYPTDFYYSFAYKNSYFIVLNQNQDYSGMLSCNGGNPCEEYCSDPSLYLDNARNNYCYSVYKYDWLVTELMKANNGGFEHIFVFSHAPLLTSSSNHSATHGAEQIRELLETYNVDIYFNGHNHAYERTYPVKGNSVNEQGTIYITTGSAGASTDTVNSDWFTAKSYKDWTTYNNQEEMTTYLKITVNKSEIKGEVVSLGISGVVDNFSKGGNMGIPFLNLLLE